MVMSAWGLGTRWRRCVSGRPRRCGRRTRRGVVACAGSPEGSRRRRTGRAAADWFARSVRALGEGPCVRSWTAPPSCEGGLVDRGGDASSHHPFDGQPLRVADLRSVQRRLTRDLGGNSKHLSARRGGSSTRTWRGWCCSPTGGCYRASLHRRNPSMPTLGQLWRAGTAPRVSRAGWPPSGCRPRRCCSPLWSGCTSRGCSHSIRIWPTCSPTRGRCWSPTSVWQPRTTSLWTTASGASSTSNGRQRPDARYPPVT